MSNDNIKFKSYRDNEGLISYMKIVKLNDYFHIFYESNKYQIKITPELDHDFTLGNCDLIIEKIKSQLPNK
jgi:hypothetical protein